MSSPLAPLSFRSGAVAKNRLALAPLTNQQSHADGTLGEDELRFLARRARGGFGLVETCAAHVSRDGQAFPGQLGIFSDAHLPGLTRLASVLAAHGALGVVQLHHGGARCPAELIGQQPLGASALAEPPRGMASPREASSADVERIADDFVRAAQRAHRAGFQGVELHAAHAYLLGQFLSRATNLRTDAWGGSLENRARLLRSITRRVRISVPASFLLGVRLSPEDFGSFGGLDLDESIQIARWLAEDGVDLVHLSLWDYRRNTAKRPAEHAVPLFRRALPNDVRLVAAGGIWSREDVETLLSLGADMVAAGKAAILDPDWPARLETPGFLPERGPLSPQELESRDVGPAFVDYLSHRFKELVAG